MPTFIVTDKKTGQRYSYKAEDSAELFEKAPDVPWTEVLAQAGANFIPSAVQFADDLTYPVRHPIKTAEGMWNLGSGAVQKLIPGEQGNEKYANAAGQFFADRYGGMDRIKNTLANDPVGLLGDVSTVLTGGAMAAAKAPSVAAKLSKAATVTDPLHLAGKTAKAASKYGGWGISAGTGALTGAGGDAISLAYQAGRSGGEAGAAFKDNMRGVVPQTDVLVQAGDAMDSIRANRGEVYDQSMSKITQDTEQLNFEPILQEWGKIKKDLSVEGLNINPNNKLATEMETALREWGENPAAHTIKGLDGLKRRISHIADKFKEGTNDRRVADTMMHKVSSIIAEQAPEYQKVMDEYAADSRVIDDLQSTLSLRDSASTDTKLRKFQSVMRNNVNTNYGERMRLVDELVKAGANNMPEALAGQALNSASPRGFGQLMMGAGIYGGATLDPAAFALLPASSPRVVGETAFAAGQAARGLNKAAEIAPRVGPTIRDAALQAGRVPQYEERNNKRMAELVAMILRDRLTSGAQ